MQWRRWWRSTMVYYQWNSVFKFGMQLHQDSRWIVFLNGRELDHYIWSYSLFVVRRHCLAMAIRDCSQLRETAISNFVTAKNCLFCFLDSTVPCNHHHGKCQGNGVSGLDQRQCFIEETAFSNDRHSIHRDGQWHVCSAAYDSVALFLSHTTTMTTTIECIPF
jgi:hypothetical protein